MTTKTLHAHAHHDVGARVLFGFWTFILSDFVLFATLFAAYVVLKDNVYNSIGISQVASLPYVLVTSLFLLTTSFTIGLSLLAAKCNQRTLTMVGLVVTLIFGLAFVYMEYRQFAYLFHEGFTWHNSAFLSAYYGLVGLHWLHTIVALVWLVFLFIQFCYNKTDTIMRTKLSCLSLFIHFLNIVWIFIFTIVYLMGVL